MSEARLSCIAATCENAPYSADGSLVGIAGWGALARSGAAASGQVLACSVTGADKQEHGDEDEHRTLAQRHRPTLAVEVWVTRLLLTA
jgi:hypothetical protein